MHHFGWCSFMGVADECISKTVKNGVSETCDLVKILNFHFHPTAAFYFHPTFHPTKHPY